MCNQTVKIKLGRDDQNAPSRSLRNFPRPHATEPDADATPIMIPLSSSGRVCCVWVSAIVFITVDVGVGVYASSLIFILHHSHKEQQAQLAARLTSLLP